MKIPLVTGSKIKVRNATQDDTINGSSVEKMPFPDDMPEKTGVHRGHLILMENLKNSRTHQLTHSKGEVVFSYISIGRNEKKDDAGIFTVSALWQ